MSRSPEENLKLYEGDLFAPAFDINLNNNNPAPFKYNYVKSIVSYFGNKD